MTLSDLESLLHASLSGLGALISVTVTDLPADERGLRQLLAKAAEVARLKATPMIEIQLPRGRFPGIGATYGGAPVRDCGPSSVLRLVYGKQPVIIAA